MNRLELRRARIRTFPKVGWRNRLARSLLRLKERPAPTRFLDYQNKTPLLLPFAGEWYVYWGGRTVGQNRHAATRDQRFAYDFLILQQGRSYRGTGERNDDYYCFAESLYAPADGVVVSVGNDVPDNLPGDMNAKAPLGNHVILDHGQSEFSFIAHLKQGSVLLHIGDKVRAGDLLGQCGNSGHSSEPHLHYHLQNTAVLYAGEGLPAKFSDYFSNGKAVTRGEPGAGQTVRNQREQRN